jgi:hypothetical protein
MTRAKSAKLAKCGFSGSDFRFQLLRARRAVFKRVLTQRNENDALQAVALMQQAPSSISTLRWRWTRRS